MNPFQIRLVDPLGSSGLIPLAGISLGVSHDEGSLGDQQWSSSAGHVQGVGSGRDKGQVNRSQSFKSSL
ncbi:hypothetical protein MTR67_047290 [Solanum verrucosum]|uniref:Uncharacterized protein n=1 Tax=Solanum verrucosum TaxID=315347 RepID=A0AAF0UW95_SOLVR|nr:hypothetical protein MTR67_047290 [Solanum verrucosum]